MSKVARHLVSQKKKRTVDKSVPKGSVDLDLTEIHDRIVCMGYPATGVEAFYRNKYEDALRYLDHKYGEDYMVYNLCGEKAYQYSMDRFHGRVRSFPFLDHQACPLAVMPAFVKDAVSWIQSRPNRVVVIHCKAGKGRTGIMACCLLMIIEPSLLGSPEEIMKYYGGKRTIDGRGLTVPSQRRSVKYYARLRNEFGGEVPSTVPTIRIDEVRLHDFAPKVSVHWLRFYNNDEKVFLRLKDVKRDDSLVKLTSAIRVTESGVQEDVVHLNCSADPRFREFRGDLKIEITDGNGIAGILSINTLFMQTRYESKDIDKLNKKFDLANPCAIEFSFTVIAGSVAAARPASPPSPVLSASSESSASTSSSPGVEADSSLE